MFIGYYCTYPVNYTPLGPNQCAFLCSQRVYLFIPLLAMAAGARNVTGTRVLCPRAQCAGLQIYYKTVTLSFLFKVNRGF